MPYLSRPRPGKDSPRSGNSAGLSAAAWPYPTRPRPRTANGPRVLLPAPTAPPCTSTRCPGF